MLSQGASLSIECTLPCANLPMQGTASALAAIAGPGTLKNLFIMPCSMWRPGAAIGGRRNVGGALSLLSNAAARDAKGQKKRKEQFVMFDTSGRPFPTLPGRPIPA